MTAKKKGGKKVKATKKRAKKGPKRKAARKPKPITTEPRSMILSHRSLAPLHCASRDEYRPGLRVLHFSGIGQTVATNGHILARFIPAKSLVNVDDVLLPFELGIVALTPIQKEQARQNATPFTVNAQVTNFEGQGKGQQGVCRIESTGREGSREIPKEDGDFPEWMSVIKGAGKREVGAEPCVGLDLLEALIATARAFNRTRKGGGGGVRFYFPKNSEEEVRAEVKDESSGDRIEFVLMPMRL